MGLWSIPLRFADRDFDFHFGVCGIYGYDFRLWGHGVREADYLADCGSPENFNGRETVTGDTLRQYRAIRDLQLRVAHSLAPFPWSFTKTLACSSATDKVLYDQSLFWNIQVLFRCDFDEHQILPRANRAVLHIHDSFFLPANRERKVPLNIRILPLTFLCEWNKIKTV